MHTFVVNIVIIHTWTRFFIGTFDLYTPWTPVHNLNTCTHYEHMATFTLYTRWTHLHTRNTWTRHQHMDKSWTNAHHVHTKNICTVYIVHNMNACAALDKIQASRDRNEIGSHRFCSMKRINHTIIIKSNLMKRLILSLCTDPLSCEADVVAGQLDRIPVQIVQI